MIDKTIAALIAAGAASFSLLASPVARADARDYGLSQHDVTLQIRCGDDAGDTLVDDQWIVPSGDDAHLSEALAGALEAATLRIGRVERTDAVKTQLEDAAKGLFESAEIALRVLLVAHPDRIRLVGGNECLAAAPVLMSLVDMDLNGVGAALGQEDCLAGTFEGTFAIDLAPLVSSVPKHLEDTLFAVRIGGDEGARDGVIELDVGVSATTDDAEMSCTIGSSVAIALD